METVQRPLILYVDNLRSGQWRELFSNNYVWYWIGFLIAAVVVYWLLARMLFSALNREGMRVDYCSQCAIVAGLFGVVVSFYLVFMLTPGKATAWILEVTFLLAWFVFLIFSWVTTPPTLS